MVFKNGRATPAIARPLTPPLSFRTVPNSFKSNYLGKVRFSWGGGGRVGASGGGSSMKVSTKRGGSYLFVSYSRGGSHTFSRIF